MGAGTPRDTLTYHLGAATSDKQEPSVMSDRRERQATGGFALRLREVIDAYGSANSIAKAIERSEGAVRKWLRGESEPNVTDLRTLCEQTQTSIEWLVTGRGSREAGQSVHTLPKIGRASCRE